MLAFLLGISITINVVCIFVIIAYLKLKADKDFFDSDFVVDKKEAYSFLSDDKK